MRPRNLSETHGVQKALPQVEPAPSRPNRKEFLGIPIDLLSPQDACSVILAWRGVGRCGCVSFINPHSILSCARDRSLRSAILSCNLALADGVGITLAARLLGYGRVCRLPGPSFMLRVCDLGRAHGLRHFFYGGGENVAARLAEHLAMRFPGLEVAGTCCPPFREPTAEEDSENVALINATSPDLVWVALGTGRQEKWMAAHAGRINATALLAVGAAFDFHAGTVPRAPAWVGHTGLEWAYRLAIEPGRLWRRNLDSPAFLARVIAQRIGIAAARVANSEVGHS